jgi:hypothetical protein
LRPVHGRGWRGKNFFSPTGEGIYTALCKSASACSTGLHRHGLRGWAFLCALRLPSLLPLVPSRHLRFQEARSRGFPVCGPTAGEVNSGADPDSPMRRPPSSTMSHRAPTSLPSPPSAEPRGREGAAPRERGGRRSERGARGGDSVARRRRRVSRRRRC